MQRRDPEPRFRIWIEGKPQSSHKNAAALARYKASIRKVASTVVSKPIRSPRVDIEIWFYASHLSRADVDNVIKPVLDALNGVAYQDDRQVRSVRVVAFPKDDHIGIPGWVNGEVQKRLLK